MFFVVGSRLWATMAPKRCYDLARLEEAAEEAAKRAQAALGINAALTCRCDGVVGGGKFKKTAMVQFAWCAAVCDVDGEHMVQVRWDHACAQGIPLPEPLKVACRRYRLAQVAKEAESAVKFDGAVVTCRLDYAHHVL